MTLSNLDGEFASVVWSNDVAAALAVGQSLGCVDPGSLLRSARDDG